MRNIWKNHSILFLEREVKRFERLKGMGSLDVETEMLEVVNKDSPGIMLSN